MTFYADLAYLLSAFLFLAGLKQLSSPATARRGNQMAALAMLIAIVVTLVQTEILTWTMIITGILIGSLIGAAAARMVKMTAMPEMVGIFNGFGGGASAHVVIDLGSVGSVDGRVRNAETGDVLGGVTVEAFIRPHSSTAGASVVWRTTTEKDGVFRFDRVPEGTAIVRCNAPGLGFATSDEVAIAGSHRITIPEFFLKPR